MTLRARCLCLVAGAAISPLAADDAAARLYRDARRAERAGQFTRAYVLYAQAAAREPDNTTYWARSQALRTQALLQARPTGLASSQGERELPEPASTDLIDGSISDHELAEARTLLPPPRLQPDPARHNFDLRGNERALFTAVIQAYKLDLIFDGDYPASAPQQQLRLSEANFHEAIHALESLTSSFVVVLSERLLLVVKDTQQKRTEQERTVAVVIPIPEPVTVQEAQELARAVQQMMEIQKLSVDNGRRLVLIRDRLSKVRPAQRLFEQLAASRAEVMVEVEFIEVARNSSLSYGLRLPTQWPLVNFSKILNSVPSIPAGFTKFLVFGGGKSFFGLGITDAEMFASMTKSVTSTVLKAQMRSLDGMAGTLHIGDRFPIITSGYFGSTEGTGEVFRPPPQITFEDLGLVIKITPRVHDATEVTLELEAEFKVLTGQTLNDIPVIANRKFNSRVRLRMGEWAIVTGLLTASEARSLSGIAGLSQLPVLGALFRSNDRTRTSGETLLVLKPYLLAMPPSESVTPALWVGAEGRLRSPL